MVRRPARVVPSVEDVRALIRAVSGDWRKRDRWLVYLTAATTGLRWSQLKRLEWGMVRLDASPPHLDLPPELAKNGEPTIVWLTAELAGALRAHGRAEYRFVPNSGDVPPERVFRAVPKPTSFDRDLAKAGLAKAGGSGKTLSFHSLRHFASNRMAWVGFTTGERQRQNQHLTPSMTTQIYTDPENIELGRKVLQMPGLLPDAAPSSEGAHGDSAEQDLTTSPDRPHHGPVTMLANQTHLDLQTAADADAGIVTDSRVGAAALSGPRHRAEGHSRESGRLDSNHRPRDHGRGREAGSVDVAHGHAPGREAPRDPLTLAIEIAESSLRLARELAARHAEGAHRGHRESGTGGGDA